MDDNLVLQSLSSFKGYLHKYFKQLPPSVIFGFDDIQQIAVIGIIKAVKKFDHSKNIPFNSYALTRAIGEIKDARRDAADKRRKQNHQIVKIPEHVSFDAIVGEKDGKFLVVEDVLFDERLDDELDVFCTKELSNCLQQAIQSLNDAERYVITGLFFREQRQILIAEEMQLSESRVSQLKKRALRKLKQYLSENYLIDGVSI